MENFVNNLILFPVGFLKHAKELSVGVIWANHSQIAHLCHLLFFTQFIVLVGGVAVVVNQLRVILTDKSQLALGILVFRLRVVSHTLGNKLTAELLVKGNLEGVCGWVILSCARWRWRLQYIISVMFGCFVGWRCNVGCWLLLIPVEVALGARRVEELLGDTA